MSLHFQHDGKFFRNWTFEAALAFGVPQSVLAPFLKAQAEEAVEALAEAARRRVSFQSPAKMGEWLLKQKIAEDPATARPALLVLFDREAVARGLDRDGFVALVNAKAEALENLALEIAARAAEASASLAAIDDNHADLPGQIAGVLSQTKTDLNAAVSAAESLINQGV